MSNLGQFLERFFSPEPTFRTVRARIRHSRKASVVGASSARRQVIGRRNTDSKPRDESEETLLLWAVPPGHVRIETQRTRNDQPENIVEVSNGVDSWKRFANGKVERGTVAANRARRKDSLPTEYQRHFDRRLIRQFFAAMTLEPIGNGHVAGRECLRIRAIQVPDSQLWPHWLSFEADEYEFAADVERAVLLSIAGKVAGQLTEQHEVQEVAFDEDFDESLFTYKTEHDEAVEPATPVVEHISLEAAISRAPFTVLQPTYLPDNDRLQCETMYHPARPDCPDEHLSLLYRGGTLFDYLWINQRLSRENRMHDELQWEEVNVAGRPFEVSDPGPDEGLRVVVFQQDGTYVDIISDMHLDELLKIAMSFECADGSG